MSSNELANLISKLYIARPDVKAIQAANGDYYPHTSDPEHKIRVPWNRTDLVSHIEGRQTFGHYLLNRDSQCKLFMFDIDLKKVGTLPTDIDETSFEAADLRAAWMDRSHVGRTYMKRQFKLIAHKLVKTIEEELDLRVAVAYSGGKGIHVYAFTDLISGYEARKGAQIVLDSIGEFKPYRGDSFYEHVNADERDGFPNLSIEIFPKQETIKPDDPGSLGNLVRLPLGRNMKNPKDPTFFIDMTTALNELKPLDPVHALTSGLIEPWRKIGE